MHTTEEWRRVSEFPDYEVSSFGRVRSWIAHMGRPVPHVLKPGLTLGGYEQVSMRIPGDPSSRRTVAVHRIAALTFLGPRPGHARKVHVCHNDGDKRNNRVDNLRYDTAQANVADAIIHGTHASLTELRKTHCKHGHPYDDQNTYLYVAKNGNKTRCCRTCHRASDSTRKARNAA